MTYDPETYWPNRYERQGDTYVAKGGRADSHDAQLEALVPHLDHLPSEGRALDYGCGPGRFREPLEVRGLDYEGVDLVPELGTMKVGDIQPESFDCAVAIYVLQHIVDEDDYAEAVGVIWRALKTGGCLLVVDHNPDPTVDWQEHMNPRGWRPVERWGWSDFKRVGGYDGHWIGVFRK